MRKKPPRRSKRHKRGLIELLASFIENILRGASVAELILTFIPGCYLLTGALGSGKSYVGTRIGLILAAKLGYTFVSNYPLVDPWATYAVRQLGLEMPKCKMISMHLDDPIWKQRNCVFVIDEVLYYMEKANLRKRFVGDLVHARKRDQIVLLLSQAPLHSRYRFVVRYILKTEFWIPLKLFRVSLIDPRATRKQRSVLRVFNVILTKWFSKSYDTWYDFDEAENDRSEAALSMDNVFVPKRQRKTEKVQPS
jgi:hypothetical protein